MRLTDIFGVLGTLLACVTWLYAEVTGTLPLPGKVALYVGLVGMLYWIYSNIEAMVRGMRTRSVQQTGVGVLVVLLGVGLFAASNYIASRHPKRFDATDVGLFTLAPQTLKVLEALDTPVRLLAFFPDTMETKSKFADLVEGYLMHSDKLTVQWVDPDFEPGLTTQYGIRVAGTVVLESGDQTEQLTSVTEEDLTNALISVTRAERKAIYVLEGSGELNMDHPGDRSMLRATEELRKKGFAVESLNLLAEGAIPADARVLVIAGPRRDMLEKEKAALDGWLDGGGRILLLLDPESPSTYLALANERGIETPEAIIVDMVGQSYVGDATMPVVVPMAPHEITRDMRDDVVVLRYARPLRRGEAAHGEHVQSLFGSTQNAWGETDMNAFKVAELEGDPDEATILRYDEGADIAGPVEVMILSQWPVGEPPTEEELDSEEPPTMNEGMLAVVGDSDFASDLLFDAKLNGDLLLNVVSYLAQERDLISIRPRSRDNQPFTPSEAEGALVKYGSLLVLPGLSFLMALIMFLRRRNL